MGIYGHALSLGGYTEVDNILLSEGTTPIEEGYNKVRKGLAVMNEASKDPMSYQIYSENGNYYISSRDLQRFCEATGDFNISNQLSRICSANGVNEAIVVYDYCDKYFTECLTESGVVLEKAAEDDAVTLKQTMRWYDEFVKASRSKVEDKEDLKERIKVLKKCVKNMEQAKYSGSARAKYALKALIPFNDIWRLIVRRDAYAGITGISRTGLSLIVNVVAQNAVSDAFFKGTGDALKATTADGFANSLKATSSKMKNSVITSYGVNAGLKVGEVIIRAVTFNKMLDKRIKETNEAIDYLESKLKDY
jgi:hypothetical protein